jgi:hypothetical protein
MKKRIRIFFIACPTLDTDALSYLLLSQNTAQSVFQFEIYHYWIFAHRNLYESFGLWDRLLLWYGDRPLLPFRNWIDRRNRSHLDQKKTSAFAESIDPNNWLEQVKASLVQYDNWYSKNVNNYDTVTCPTIIITQASIEGGFISYSNGPYGLISAARWREFFKPVSVLEYILFSVQRLSLRMSHDGVVGSHYPVRGCIWDYDDHQPDARIATLLGYICETCHSRLEAKAGTAEMKQIEEYVKNDWIYDIHRPSSPASVLAKTYKYDLIKTKGLNSNWFSRVLSSVESNFGSIVSDGIKWAFVLITLLLLTKYFPSLVATLQDALMSLT